MNVGMSVFCDKSDFSQDNWEGRERAVEPVERAWGRRVSVFACARSSRLSLLVLSLVGLGVCSGRHWPAGGPVSQHR